MVSALPQFFKPGCYVFESNRDHFNILCFITLADTDGNDATTADATWTPVVPTPNHPEYPAAHGCAGKVQAAAGLAGSYVDFLKAYGGEMQASGDPVPGAAGDVEPLSTGVQRQTTHAVTVTAPSMPHANAESSSTIRDTLTVLGRLAPNCQLSKRRPASGE